jgi:hypothetical protein
MSLALAGDTVPEAGTPGTTNCRGKSMSALAHQFGDLDEAVLGLGFSDAEALHDGFRQFCSEGSFEQEAKRIRRASHAGPARLRAM